MTLLSLHIRLAGRWLREVGWFLPVVLAAALLAAAGLAAVTRWSVAAALLLALLPLVQLHRHRRDLMLLRTTLRHPARALAAEYLLLALPAAGIIALAGGGPETLTLPAAAPFVTLWPRRRPRATRPLAALHIAWTGYSPEWTAALRRHPAAAGIGWAATLGAAAIPWAGFPVLCLAALLATEIYTRNEPLSLLLLADRSAARLLGGKLRTAWRNLFAASLPAAVLTLVLYPETAWMAAVWIPYAALAMTYAVLAKYAAYDPRTPDAAPAAAARIGLLGLLLPPLLPVTLLLTIRYAVRAERNLDRYLHDYD